MLIIDRHTGPKANETDVQKAILIAKEIRTSITSYKSDEDLSQMYEHLSKKWLNKEDPVYKALNTNTGFGFRIIDQLI